MFDKKFRGIISVFAVSGLMLLTEAMAASDSPNVSAPPSVPAGANKLLELPGQPSKNNKDQTTPTPIPTQTSNSVSQPPLVPLPAVSSTPAPTNIPIVPLPATHPNTQPPVASLPVVATPATPPIASPAESSKTTLSSPPIQSVAPQTPSPSTATSTSDNNILTAPLHIGNTSILFSKSDIDILQPLIEIYDNNRSQKTNTGSGNKGEDLNALLQSLTAHEETPAAVTPFLPNLYLGSIVYYSPSHWSVWINGKKIVNTYNASTNEFYVTRISRTEAELVWRPSTLLDTPALWQQLTNSGKNSLPNIEVEEPKGTITLRMRPNQTFLSKTLAIREGLIKSNNSAPVNPGRTDNISNVEGPKK